VVSSGVGSKDNFMAIPAKTAPAPVRWENRVAPMPDTVSFHPVSPRFWLARQAVLAALAVPMTLAALVLLVALPNPGTVAILVCVVAATVAMWTVERGRYRAWGYAERDQDLVVRRGLLFRNIAVVPYGRMQFIDVAAGPVDRLFDLATVQLHTAAAASDARIPGLRLADAQRLRDRLAGLGEARATGL
jgi:membrane protein YdbS with pleckstrin-like domain